MNKKKKTIMCVVILVVIIAISVLLGIFIGKGNTEKNTETETTTETVLEDTTEISTTENDISVTVVDGFVSDTDRNNFSQILAHILWFSFLDADYFEGEYTSTDYARFNYCDYDCKSADAKTFAYSRILAGYYTLPEALNDIYDWADFEIKELFVGEDTFTPDPKDVLGEVYHVIDEKYVDICLKTVFNITPDYDYVLKSKDGEVQAYYHEGKYYYRAYEGGDAVGPKIVINDIDIMNDGKLLIKTTYYEVGYDFQDELFDVNVVAEMKNVQGNNIWSIYEIDCLLN